MDKISWAVILEDVDLKDVIEVVNELITKQGEVVDWINKREWKERAE